MPEGHTVHRLGRRDRTLPRGPVGRVPPPPGRVVDAPQGRCADAALVDGQGLDRADAFGKHLFHDYGNGLSVHVHLGIYGEFHEREPGFEPRPTTRMRLEADHVVLDLIGPTTCEVLDAAGRAAVVARIGPDPLRRDADPERAWERL